jgi:hypothetical protein
MAAIELVLTLAPDLPGAACVAHRDVFDKTVEPGGARHYAAAIQICTTACPAFTACKAWIEGLPRSRRPFGVTGGLIHSTKAKSHAA